MKTLFFSILGSLLLAAPTTVQQNTGMIVIVQGCSQWQMENQREVAVEVTLGDLIWSLAAKEKRYLRPPQSAVRELKCQWKDGLRKTIALAESKSP